MNSVNSKRWILHQYRNHQHDAVNVQARAESKIIVTLLFRLREDQCACLRVLGAARDALLSTA